MKCFELAKIYEILLHTDGNQKLTWLVGTHSMLEFSGIIFALMHYIFADIQPVKDK